MRVSFTLFNSGTKSWGKYPHQCSIVFLFHPKTAKVNSYCHKGKIWDFQGGTRGIPTAKKVVLSWILSIYLHPWGNPQVCRQLRKGEKIPTICNSNENPKRRDTEIILITSHRFTHHTLPTFPQSHKFYLLCTHNTFHSVHLLNHSANVRKTLATSSRGLDAIYSLSRVPSSVCILWRCPM